MRNLLNFELRSAICDNNTLKKILNLRNLNNERRIKCHVLKI